MKTKGLLLTVLGGLGKGLEQQGLQMREDRLNALKSAQTGMAELGRQEAVAKENTAQRTFLAEQGEVKFEQEKDVLDIRQMHETELAKEKMKFESREGGLNRASQQRIQSMANMTRLTSERERSIAEFKIAKIREANLYNIENIRSETELASRQMTIDANTDSLEKKLSAKHDEMVAKTDGALALLDRRGEIDLNKIDLAKTWDADMLGTKLAAEQNIANDTQVSVDVRHQAGIDARLAEKELQAAVALRSFENAREIAIEKNATSKDIATLRNDVMRYATDEDTRRTLDAIAAKGVTEANILELKKKLGIGPTLDTKWQSGILAAGKIDIGKEKNRITDVARVDAMTRFLETVRLKTEKNASLEDISKLRDDAKRYVADEDTRRVLDAIAAKGVTDANLLELKARLDMERTASGVKIDEEKNRIADDIRKDTMNRFLETVRLKTEKNASLEDISKLRDDAKRYVADEDTRRVLDAIAAKGVTDANLLELKARLDMERTASGVKIGEEKNRIADDIRKDTMNRFLETVKLKTEHDEMRRAAVAALQDVRSTANKTLEATKAFNQMQKLIVDQAGQVARKAAEMGASYAETYREAYVTGMSNTYPDLYKVKTVTTERPYKPSFWETALGDMPPREVDIKHFLKPTGKESPLAEKSQVRPTSGGMVKIQAVDGKWYIGPAGAVSSDGSVKVDKFAPTDPPLGYE